MPRETQPLQESQQNYSPNVNGTERSSSVGNTEEASSNQRASFRELLGEVGDEAKTLIGQELDLATAELNEKCREAKRGITFAVFGTVLLSAGTFFALLSMAAGTAVGFTALGIEPVAAIALGLATNAFLALAIGFAIWKKGRRKLSSENLKLKETTQSIQSTTEWAKSKLHHLS